MTFKQGYKLKKNLKNHSTFKNLKSIDSSHIGTFYLDLAEDSDFSLYLVL